MAKSGKKVLVTGGAGFIGSNFILYWMEKHPEDNIINLDALTYAGNLASLASVVDKETYTFIEGSICDPAVVNQVMSGVDTVVHFAAESHVDRSILNPGTFVETNVIGTQVLLDAALHHKVKHFHHISTDEVFGSLKLGESTKFTEHTPYDPRSPYSASKAGSDHLVRAYGETYGLPYTITNCSNNYGEYQFPEKLIPLAITHLIDGLKVPIYGEGNQVRDWLYVKDHCSAIEAVLQAGPTNSTYLVGGLVKDIPNKSVVTTILSCMEKDEAMLEHVSDRAGHDVRYSVDWSNINSKLGWKPSVTFEEGIQKTVDWYTQNEAWWRPLKTSAAGFFGKNYTDRK